MKSYLFLLFIYFLIYTAFLYIQISTISNTLICPHLNSIVNKIMIGIEGFSVLLGGILAAFIIPVIFLLIISLISLLVGVSLYETVIYALIKTSNKSFDEGCKDHFILYLTALVFFALFIGLFRFIFLVIILDQNDSKFIKRKIYGWFITVNVSYFFVVAILPTPSVENYYLLICVVFAIIGVVLIIIGKYLKLFVIDSRTFSIYNVKKGFKRQTGSLGSLDEVSKKAAIFISTSVIFFILLIPIGICDSQGRYAYLFQANHLNQINWYVSKKPNFWPTVISDFVVIIFISVLIILKKFNLPKFKYFYSNIKLRIILGIIFMTISSFLGGGLETLRLQIFYNWNSSTIYPASDIINQTIGNKSYEAANLTVFAMIPQIIFNGIAEVLIATTCIHIYLGVKYLYKQSINSIKYLSIALILAAFGSGGLSDIFFLVIPYCNVFNETNLNERIPEKGTNKCCSHKSQLDYVYYGLGGVALLSFIISTSLMYKFPHRFLLSQSDTNCQYLSDDTIIDSIENQVDDNYNNKI